MNAIAAWLAGEVLDLGLGEAVSRILRGRAIMAREILQQQLAKAEINIADAADKDEAAAMVFDYCEAARQGTARRNLRMLAQILAGQLATPPIYASTFLAWSRVLADLTREELIVLAEHHKALQRREKHEPLSKVFYAVTAELVSLKVVSDGEELEGILQGLGRTGLIIHQSGAIGGAVMGATVYLTTPKLGRLLKLIDMESILSEPER